MAKNGAPPGTTCESCGGADGPLQPVHRVYLEVDSAGGLHRSRTVPGVERWCPACRAVYPNEPARD